MTAKSLVLVFAILGLGSAAWALASSYRHRGTESPDRRPLVAIILTMIGLLVSLIFFMATS